MPTKGPAKHLRQLVEQARHHGVRDEAVLSAIGTVPRDLFVPKSHAFAAFDDGPLPIGHGQTISQPAMVAMMVESALLDSNSRVLEVGTGSGYGAAVLREVAAQVVTIERLEPLADRARIVLADVGYGDVKVVVGDGSLGYPEAAPYDAIVVTAAGPDAPKALLDQLGPDGRLIIPIGRTGSDQELLRITRDGEGDHFIRGTLVPVRFVPLIGDQGFPA